ncbi:MAG: DNA polymerase III subunit delta [Cyanobacteria bacterium P01_A01_bin.135]
MPTYFFWGDDDYSLSQAVQKLCQQALDPAWASINQDKYTADSDAMMALAQAMTPPFGAGQRLVWLAGTGLGQQCPKPVLAELQRTLPNVPETTVLLLTATPKPDGRLKSTKLLQQHAQVREFATIAPWKTDQLIRQVEQAAAARQLPLGPKVAELLAEAVGNDTRQLHSELAKLQLYTQGQTVTAEAVAQLVNTYTQSSLKLAAAIRQGDTATALTQLQELLNRNEAGLRILAVLVGQFRTWLWVKLLVEAGERDERAIAQAAEVRNPKRIYFLKQEVKRLRLTSLQRSLAVLLELEAGLKLGGGEMLLQTKVIELCHLFH